MELETFILGYVAENYSGLIDPTSEHAVEAPSAFYHEGFLVTFLDDLLGATGDEKIEKFLATQDQEVLDQARAEEAELIATMPHVVCGECGAVLYTSEEDFHSCPSCGSEDLENGVNHAKLLP